MSDSLTIENTKIYFSFASIGIFIGLLYGSRWYKRIINAFIWYQGFYFLVWAYVSQKSLSTFPW